MKHEKKSKSFEVVQNIVFPDQIDYLITGVASAAFGFPLPTTVSELAIFPFSAGMSNALLLPPRMPFHLPSPCPSPLVQVNAPTHG